MLWALWWIGFFMFDIIDENPRHLFFTFLTNWSYVAIGISSIMQCLASIYVLSCHHNSEGNKTPVFCKINWIVYSTATTINVVVTILYWTILSEGMYSYLTTVST